jgi:hypothetical protein
VSPCCANLIAEVYLTTIRDGDGIVDAAGAAEGDSAAGTRRARHRHRSQPFSGLVGDAHRE